FGLEKLAGGFLVHEIGPFRVAGASAAPVDDRGAWDTRVAEQVNARARPYASQTRSVQVLVFAREIRGVVGTMTGTMTGPKATPDRQPRVRGKGRALLGAVDYTLAKRALLRDFRQGILSRFDICDAHPELL